MKTIILSREAQHWWSQQSLSARNWDEFVIEHHNAFLMISKSASRSFQEIHVKIDSLQLIFGLQVSSEAILVQEIRSHNFCTE
jgi:hypothetical protein